MVTKVLTDEEANKMLDKHCANLCEFFDSVEIITTRRTPDGITVSESCGHGNYYARYGATKIHVKRLEADQTVQGVRLFETEDEL